MSINYSIQAEVVDITKDIPQSEDIFLVDTNVWYWMTYPYAETSIYNQLYDYPYYLNQALATGAKIYHSGLSLAELAHLIEKTEREKYEKVKGLIKAKEYRHNLPAERTRVASEVEAAWGVVKSLAIPLHLTVDSPTTDSALQRFKDQSVDGYDVFILEAMQNNGVVQIITDDGDYSTVPSVKVFTTNKNVIDAAVTQKKLIIR